MEDNLTNIYYLDQHCSGRWLIKSTSGERHTAGFDKQKAQDLIERLNKAHRPSVEQGAEGEIYVCWNVHDKGEKCEWELEIPKEGKNAIGIDTNGSHLVYTPSSKVTIISQLKVNTLEVPVKVEIDFSNIPPSQHREVMKAASVVYGSFETC